MTKIPKAKRLRYGMNKTTKVCSNNVILTLHLQKKDAYFNKSILLIVFDLSMFLYLILYYVIFTRAVLSLLIIKYFLLILHQVLNSCIALIRFNFYLWSGDRNLCALLCQIELLCLLPNKFLGPIHYSQWGKYFF